MNSIPKLSELLEQPEKVSTLPLEAVPALRGKLAELDTLLQMRVAMAQSNGSIVPVPLAGQPELIDSPELARRWSVPESWVRDCVRNRSGDPIPCVRLGRYVRFEWGSPDLEAWFGRRKSGANSKPEGRTRNRLTRHPISVYQ
ncbi:MAG: hypothetical protein HYX72_12810 [Acidobacteria bacterium]|nr:hypothetical protein [Acidobacteriota bacterium]